MTPTEPFFFFLFFFVFAKVTTNTFYLYNEEKRLTFKITRTQNVELEK